MEESPTAAKEDAAFPPFAPLVLFVEPRLFRGVREDSTVWAGGGAIFDGILSPATTDAAVAGGGREALLMFFFGVPPLSCKLPEAFAPLEFLSA